MRHLKLKVGCHFLTNAAILLMVAFVPIPPASGADCYTPGDGVSSCDCVITYLPVKYFKTDNLEDIILEHVSNEPLGGASGQMYNALFYVEDVAPVLGSERGSIEYFRAFIECWAGLVGVLVINTVNSGSGLVIETYSLDDEIHRNQDYRNYTVPHGPYAETELIKGEIPGVAYTIEVTEEFIRTRGDLCQSLVYINAANGYDYTQAFVDGGARVAVGPVPPADGIGFDDITKAEKFFSRLNGLEPSILEREVVMYRRVDNAVTGLGLAYSGAGNTTLAPAVYTMHYSCSPELGDPVTFYLDTWCKPTFVPPDIYGCDLIDVGHEEWIYTDGYDKVSLVRGFITYVDPDHDFDKEPGFSFFLACHATPNNAVKSVRNDIYLDGGGMGPGEDDHSEYVPCLPIVWPGCFGTAYKRGCITDSLVLPGHYASVPISLSANDFEMGGFDFLIGYDASALTATEVTMGQLLKDCGWEYFTYRYGISGNCGSACPTGMLRIVSTAETNDGSSGVLCFGPPDTLAHELARMKFLATNDRTYECQYIPIRFFWDDCGDNSISTIGGEHLYIDEVIYDNEGNLLWNESDDDQFPESARLPFVGAPDDCLNDDPLKPSASRRIHFINSGIRIMCSDSIDDRGDINLNGVPNEVADATVFTNYFLYGLSAFAVNTEGQIAATDVNADGIVLSVADLVYLIRIIIGDVLPYPKLSQATLGFSLENGILSVDGQIGAAYVEIAGNMPPELLVPHMELKYSYDTDEGVTRALVFSMEEGKKFEGDFLTVDGQLVQIEMATYEGAVVRLGSELKPSEFVLHQNRPNPFNPATFISFSLPQPLDVTLEVLNVAGQKVATIAEGSFDAGTHTVRWDADGVASGVYFYRIIAGNYEDTKKMLMLK